MICSFHIQKVFHFKLSEISHESEQAYISRKRTQHLTLKTLYICCINPSRPNV
jgi:hypothetical protein